MTRTKSIYLALLVMLSPMAAHADVIVDTGLTDPSSQYSLRSSQWIAGQFTTADDYSITSIEGWIGNLSNGGDLTAAIYTDNAGLPGTELFSMAFTSIGANTWQGLTGLSWDILAGTYYVAFEVRAGQTFSGTFPRAALSPLPKYAFTDGGNWFNSQLNTAFRINGDLQAVPEPGTLALLGLGLVGMAARRKKKV